MMVKTIQIRVGAKMKDAVDELFADLGLDTSTAVKMFFRAAVKAGGLPFAVKWKRKRMNAELLEAIEDVRLRRRASSAASEVIK
jgi:DNA-damage-inducible protein J